MKAKKTYYHVLEYGNYGKIAWQGVYNTQQEAEKQAARLKNFFPKITFEVYADTSKKEPPFTTV